MTEQVVLIPVDLNAFLGLLRSEMNAVLDTRDKKNNPEKIHSRADAAKHLGVSLSTLNDWTKQGLIECHRIGGRVFYKHSAIESALKRIKKYDRDKVH
jgi:excisionase family DNA binding protein